MSEPKRIARTAGLLYLVVGVLGGFAIAFVNAAEAARIGATTRAIAQSPS